MVNHSGIDMGRDMGMRKRCLKRGVRSEVGWSVRKVGKRTGKD